MKGGSVAKFSVNTRRLVSYKNFKFRVKWNGRYVVGVNKITPLKGTTEMVKHNNGRYPNSYSKLQNCTEYEAITLERGVMFDNEFELWANNFWNSSSGLGSEVSPKDFRKDIVVEVYNEAGQLTTAHTFFRCWVSEFQAQADLDANDNEVYIQRIKMETEGWERYYETTEFIDESFSQL